MAKPDLQYRKLPEELLAMILPLTSARDQTSLCRTSKRFRRIILPILYRHVFLSNTDNLKKFQATMTMQEDSVLKFGGYTEQLSVVITRDEDKYTGTKANWGKYLPNVSKLYVYDSRGRVNLEILNPHTIFPKLQDCALSQLSFDMPAIARNLYAFLRRHPTLTSLSVQGVMPHEEQVAMTPDIKLPHLQTYCGPYNLFRHLIQHVTEPGLKSATIDWDGLEPTEYHSTLKALADSHSGVKGTCETLFCRTGKNRDFMLDSLVVHCKGVVRLTVEALKSRGMFNAANMTRWEGLKKLEKLCLILDSEETVEDNDDTRKVVKELGVKCPRLKEFLLMVPKGNREWRRDSITGFLTQCNQTS